MAGAAIIKPAAVVINALEIESDKIEAPPSSPYKATRPNASIIPTTVPNKPINGASEAITEKKNVYQVVGHDAYSGESTYLPVKDLSAFLSELRNSRGVETNIDVTAYRTVPVSTVIEIFDQCQIQGFTHTRVRLGSKPY